MSFVPNRVYDPQISKSQRVLPLGELLVSEPTRLVGSTFMGSFSNGTADNFWATARGTNSTSVLTTSQVVLTGGTTNADWCSIASIRKARFLFACPNLFRAYLKFSAVAAANTSTFIGADAQTNGAPQTGFCFKVDGAGAVSVQSYEGGSAVLNLATGFNGELGTTYSVPDANFHAWEIVYFVAAVWFFVDGSLLHKATPTTTQYSPTMTNPVGISIVNGTSPTSRVVTIGWSSIVRYGKELHTPNLTYIAANVTAQVLKTGAGTLHTIVIGNPAVGTITIYDAVTATNTIMVLSPTATGSPITIDVHMDFFTGLCVTTSAAIRDTTFIYE